jgi:hypothetical protein
MEETDREDVCLRCGQVGLIHVGGNWWCSEHYPEGFAEAINDLYGWVSNG